MSLALVARTRRIARLPDVTASQPQPFCVPVRRVNAYSHTYRTSITTGPDQAIKVAVRTEDLSLYPRPFGLPLKFFNGNKNVIAAAKLPFEAQKEFAEKGYIVSGDHCSKSIPQELNQEGLNAMTPFFPRRSLLFDFDDRYSNYVVGGWRALYTVHDQLWNKNISIPASQLLGGAPIRLSHDFITCKQFNQFMPIHQPYHYYQWVNNPENSVIAFIPMVDVPVNEDPLVVFPGSHKLGLLPNDSRLRMPQPLTYQPTGPRSALGPFVESANDRLYPVPNPSAVTDQSLTPTQRLRAVGFPDSMVAAIPVEKHASVKPVRLPLQRGRVVFMHPLLAWGAMHNKSLSRRTFIMFHFMKDGTTFNGSKAPLEEGGRQCNYPLLHDGDKLEVKEFPRVFVPPKNFFVFRQKVATSTKPEKTASSSQSDKSATPSADQATTATVTQQS